MIRGYFGIGIEKGKNEMNYGTLYRTAQILGASFLFIIGQRFKKQCSDVYCSYRHIPTFSYSDFDSFYKNIPYDCVLVGVELIKNAVPIKDFTHPERAVYLLGAEDHGLSSEAMRHCHRFVVLPGERSMNVSVAGSIVLYDRILKKAKI